MQIIVCPSKLLFHIPCPGCGITRATLLWMHGCIKDALLINPNVLLAIAFVGGFPVLLVIDVACKKRLLIVLYHKLEAVLHHKWSLVIFLILELCIWIHNMLCHM